MTASSSQQQPGSDPGTPKPWEGIYAGASSLWLTQEVPRLLSRGGHRPDLDLLLTRGTWEVVATGSGRCVLQGLVRCAPPCIAPPRPACGGALGGTMGRLHRHGPCVTPVPHPAAQ